MPSCRYVLSSTWLLFVVAAGTTTDSRAEDWPAFGRDQTRNAVSPESYPPTDWDVGKYDRETGEWQGARNIKWVASMGSNTCGDPVVADGLVWVGTNNQPDDQNEDASRLMCLRESDGEVLFIYDSPRLAE